MQQVVVEKFGGPEVLELREVATPRPGTGQVVVKLTSIGMNHADLMERQGNYRLSSGDPPFTPGLEGGGVIEAVGQGVDAARVGQRVTLSPDAPRDPDGVGGTYRSHYLCPERQALPAPAGVPDEQLGALWLAYLTAWGCLVWKQNLQPNAWVAFSAASSSAALAGAQTARRLGAKTVGLTTREDKRERLEFHYDHVIVTHESSDETRSMRAWHRDVRQLTGGEGIDVFYDPVASGTYLETEVKCLAQRGTVWVYGLLGTSGPVDVTPLIRKHAAIRGWALTELLNAGREVWEVGVESIFAGFTEGAYDQTVAATFALAEVQAAHQALQRGDHVGKIVLVP